MITDFVNIVTLDTPPERPNFFHQLKNAIQTTIEHWHSESNLEKMNQLYQDKENHYDGTTIIQLEAKKAAAELAERQRLHRIARKKRLNEIMGREEKIWNQIEALAQKRKQKIMTKH